ncbi:host cell division inhibitory peptide Kil [Salmonella enterica]|uniref:Host cell division inhibitory peptide Kil n=1 Tax=Salmonella enterica TaxID=28901 RepID=A0A402TQ37_SALER|nr:host cell division inhibitory peptide Kil [Salmonella enterica]EDB9085120.1 host cell division inhibitory peptide Kil [Salmonella enterica subsp. enterica serovar Newport]EAO5737901.1 host cell division inhibitory peptide Kil [Salmonella enterica]EAQ0344171.1 host cell division inhibitory peptide Kil [Salmonella enterica]EAQ0896190.1 host cell division inhibitory peptide Kil [Salmonella enterica]EAQ7631866.1 host cell division inhibitory peptide Kil [Salmonella enterica]
MSYSLSINHNKLRSAQNKALIARFIGDACMWMQAGRQMKEACGYPLYRRAK